jgi:hypothetical protein
MQNAQSLRYRLWSSISKPRLGSPSARYLPRTLFRSQVSLAVARPQIHTPHGHQAHSTMETPRAPFLPTLQKYLPLDSPWGFVIYRTTAYAPTETATWEAFQQKFNLLIQETFNDAAGPEEEISAARKTWTVQWEEDSNMALWTYEDVKR